MAGEIIKQVKSYISNKQVQSEFHEILGDCSGAFLNSIVNVVGCSNLLQKCEPASIMTAAKRAATLKLPIDSSLGFAAIVPYRNQAQFQLQYKGIIQLAIRSGQYRDIDGMEIYADEIESYDRINNKVTFTPPSQHKMRANGDIGNVVGFYGFFELLNGFRKSRYISRDEALRHAERYSRSYQYDLKEKKQSSVWSTNLSAMGIKTVLKMILSTYGIMSIEMQEAFIEDNKSFDNVLNNNAEHVNETMATETVTVSVSEEPAIDVTAEVISDDDF